MKVIFLDVDGVLNCLTTKDRTPHKYVGIEDNLVNNLKKIVDATEAKIVLVSSWKPEWEKYEEGMTLEGKYLDEKIKKAGLEIFDKTEDDDWNRGFGILVYLNMHPEIDKFVILDDIIFNDYRKYNYLNNLIQTDEVMGLSSEDINKAISILS